MDGWDRPSGSAADGTSALRYVRWQDRADLLREAVDGLVDGDLPPAGRHPRAEQAAAADPTTELLPWDDGHPRPPVPGT